MGLVFSTCANSIQLMHVPSFLYIPVHTVTAGSWAHRTLLKGYKYKLILFQWLLHTDLLGCGSCWLCHCPPCCPDRPPWELGAGKQTCFAGGESKDAAPERLMTADVPKHCLQGKQNPWWVFCPYQDWEWDMYSPCWSRILGKCFCCSEQFSLCLISGPSSLSQQLLHESLCHEQIGFLLLSLPKNISEERSTTNF